MCHADRAPILKDNNKMKRCIISYKVSKTNILLPFFSPKNVFFFVKLSGIGSRSQYRYTKFRSYLSWPQVFYITENKHSNRAVLSLYDHCLSNLFWSSEREASLAN